MDFESDIREFVLSHLPVTREQRSLLECESASELLLIYLNWQSRLIEAVPRRAHLSQKAERQLSELPIEQAEALRSILDKIALGVDLTAHLSRDVRIAYTEKSRRKGRRRDLDLLLNDWGLHHLHLSLSAEPDGFVTRTRRLLVAAFRPSDAYLVELVDHGEWSKESLLETMIDEWPNANLVLKMNGVLGLERSITQEQRADLRKHHVNAMFEYKGAVYMPAMGLTSAGTATRTSMQGTQILRNIRWLEQQIESDRGFLVKKMATAGIVPIPKPDWHFDVFDSGGYGVTERQTGFRVRLG